MPKNGKNECRRHRDFSRRVEDTDAAGEERRLVQWMSRYVCRCRMQDAGYKDPASQARGSQSKTQIRWYKHERQLSLGARRGTTFRSHYYVDEPTTSLKPLQKTGLETETLDSVTVHRQQA